MTSVLISAGDASGDLHAADFVSALRELRPDVRFLGLGGDAMAKAGVDLVIHQRELAIGGLLELAAGARRIFRVWRAMTAACSQVNPDLVVLVDSGGFNLPFARRVRRQGRARILYYVAPQVWAWRRGRIRKLAKRVDRMAVIFPFEPEVYSGTGLAVDYVGHPLVEPLALLEQGCDRESARARLGLAAEGEWLAVFPGSRSNEVHAQLPIQLAAAKRLGERRAGLGVLLVLAPTVSRAQIDAIISDASLPDAMPLRVVEGRSREAILAADCALAKPGTVTVEITLLGRPMVVIGRASPVTAAIVRRAVALQSLTMPNLIANAPIVPEFLQQAARPEAIADALFELFDGPRRDRQLADLADVKEKLGRGGAATHAAAIAEEMLGTPRS